MVHLQDIQGPSIAELEEAARNALSPRQRLAQSQDSSRSLAELALDGDELALDGDGPAGGGEGVAAPMAAAAADLPSDASGEPEEKGGCACVVM